MRGDSFEVVVDGRGCGVAEAVSDGARPSVEIESPADLVIHARRLADQALSDPVRSEPEVRALLAEARRRGEPLAVVLCLRALAAVHRSRWEHDEAGRLLGRAIALSRREAAPRLEAEVRGARAAVRHGQGNVVAARRDIDAALRLIGGPTPAADEEHERLRAYLELQVAVLDHNAGRLRDAERWYRRIGTNPHRSDDIAVRTANNLAMVLTARGAYDEALAASETAVAVAARLGPLTSAIARQTHAWIVIHQGRLTQGMAEFDEVASGYRDAGAPLGEYDIEVSDAMADLRLLPEAIAAAQAAVDEFAEARVWLMWVEAQVRLAARHLAAGDPRRAQELAAAAAARSRAQRRVGWTDRARLVETQARLATGASSDADATMARRVARRFEQSGDLADAAQAYLVAGRAAVAAGRPAAARASLADAGRIAARGPLLLRVRGRLALATAARIDGDGPAVVREAGAGLRDLAAHRDTLPTMELRALASGHGAELGEIGLAELLRDGTPAQALRWMERTRAAAILARLPLHEPEEDEPQADEAPSTLGAGLPVALPARAAWTVLPGLAQLRAGLDGRVLVETGLCEGRYVAVVVRGRSARVVDLGPRENIEEPLHALVFALRRLASPRSEAAAQAARVNAEARLRVLRERLVGPLSVNRDDELVVAPVGPLHGVPWSALHDGPLSLAPSATAWLGTAATAWPRTTPGIVLVAGPGLTGAQEEVDALAAVHPRARVFDAESSFVGPVSRALATADLAHVACHGVPRADNPMFSSLVLADGPVTIQELHRAGVAPRRLVLASCHSGADVAYAGDEVLGFVSGMLARGTAGVVANIAAVPDVEVVDLMVALHRGLAAGETMARALHAARGRIDTDSPSGFVNWCTFGAHGAA
jgi:hypothetical protein